jgi:oligopeptide transport system substrate-binding protein
MKNLIKNLFVLALALGLVGGCSSDRKTPVEIGNEQQIMHLGNGGEPADVDPHTTSGLPENQIQRSLFEGLVSRTSESLEVIPGVAESWDISEDRLTFTFHIRKNARWSNGDTLNAHDFVWAWQRALNPGLGNQYAYMYYVMKNAEAYNKGEITDFSEVGIRALDDYRLQVELSGPTPYLLELLAFKTMYPVHRATVEKFGGVDRRATAWTRPENFVGNGPFVIKEWAPNQVLSVKKNPYYWDSDNIRLNEIHFYPIQSANTEERMFRAGQLHFINVLPVDKIEAYKTAGDPAYDEFPLFTTYYYHLNTTKAPLNDVRVRKALAYSIDRALITEKVMKGGQLPAFNFTPPNDLGYTPEAKMVFDVELARKLLAEAGYPDGKGFPEVTILYNTLEQHQTIAVVIQQMWKEALGIDVNMRNEDWKVYLDNVRTMNYDIARAGWGGDYVDPNTFLDVHVTDGGQNKTGWSNARYDELIRLAAQTADQNQRFAYFQEAEAILVEEAPIIPIYTYVRNRLVHPAIKNWHSNILDDYFYKHVYLEADSGEQ